MVFTSIENDTFGVNDLLIFSWDSEVLLVQFEVDLGSPPRSTSFLIANTPAS
eukprot:m.159638 g.159638  ORF g.159638 m.159638 type:complete len:52 (-) comp13374_c0_seq2:1527-1682(-)